MPRMRDMILARDIEEGQGGGGGGQTFFIKGDIFCSADFFVFLGIFGGFGRQTCLSLAGQNWKDVGAHFPGV